MNILSTHGKAVELIVDYIIREKRPLTGEAWFGNFVETLTYAIVAKNGSREKGPDERISNFIISPFIMAHWRIALCHCSMLDSNMQIFSKISRHLAEMIINIFETDLLFELLTQPSILQWAAP
jgi:hypothetical protein